jgi:CRP-like cAMP-binding protein
LLYDKKLLYKKMYSKDFVVANSSSILRSFSSLEYTSLSQETAELQKLAQTNMLEAVKRILSIPAKERPPALLNILTSYTANLTFFQNLVQEQSKEAHMACCQQMTCEEFKRKEYVFRQGEEGTKFYIILRGTVSVIINTLDEIGRLEHKKVTDCIAGDSFGERAIVLGQNRTASIQCNEDCVFAVLDYYDFKMLLDKAIEQRFNSKVDLLKGISIFKGVPRHVLYKLTYHLEERSYKRKQALFNEGDTPTHMYILRNGEVKFTKAMKLFNSTDEATPTSRFSSKSNKTFAVKSQVAIIGANELFGEEEIFSRQPREYNSECYSTSADVFEISYDNFMLTFSTHKSVFKLIKKQIKLKENIRKAQILSYVTIQAENNFTNTTDNSTEEVKKSTVIIDSPDKSTYNKRIVKPTKDLFRWPNTNKNNYAIRMIGTELKRRSTLSSDISMENLSPSPGARKFKYTIKNIETKQRRPTPTPSRLEFRRSTASEKSFKIFQASSTGRKHSISSSNTPINIHTAALRSKASRSSPELKGSGPKMIPIGQLFDAKKGPNHLSIRNLEVYEDLAVSGTRSVNEKYLRARSRRIVSSKHSLFRLRVKV